MFQISDFTNCYFSWRISNCCYDYGDWMRSIKGWLRKPQQLADMAEYIRNLKPIISFPIWWHWNRPMLVRRLPMWSARRWKSVT